MAFQYRCRSCRGIRRFLVEATCPRCGAWGPPMKEHLPEHDGRRRLHDLVAPPTPRWPTGLACIDRMLGGNDRDGWGLPRAAVVLLSGEPGIGKSRWTTSLAAHVSRWVPVLYASAEEGLTQLAERRQGMEIYRSDVEVLAMEDNARDARLVAATADRSGARLVIDDSLQASIVDDENDAGSVAQVNNVAEFWCRWAKDASRRVPVAVILICHVTKDGTFAGPKRALHMVDVEMAYEGSPESDERDLRVIKNRFGSSGRTAYLRMDDHGRLVERAPPPPPPPPKTPRAARPASAPRITPAVATPRR